MNETQALIGSNLFPSTLRLADGRDIALGDLVRRAADGWADGQWNFMPQDIRDAAMVKALDDWQREATPNIVTLIGVAQALEQKRALAIVADIAEMGDFFTEVDGFRAGWDSACDEIKERLRTEVWTGCLPPIAEDV